jgi:hypothetical protein
MESKTQTIVGFFAGEPFPPRLSIIITRVDKIGMQSLTYYSDNIKSNITGLK